VAALLGALACEANRAGIPCSNSGNCPSGDVCVDGACVPAGGGHDASVGRDVIARADQGHAVADHSGGDHPIDRRDAGVPLPEVPIWPFDAGSVDFSLPGLDASVMDMDSGPSADALGDCGPGGVCEIGLLCCHGKCVDPFNDPNNCNGCDMPCTGSASVCANGTCEVPPCTALTCGAGSTCCGDQCCGAGQLCCMVEGPGPSGYLSCFDNYCPPGCPTCQ
jgi:hypothetical protein